MNFTDSLKKNCLFRLVYAKGASVANRFVVMYVLKNNLPVNRVGFTVGKKVGISVVRNRVRRLLRESYRLQELRLLAGYDIVFVARASCKDATYRDIESAVLSLARRHGITANK